MPAHQSAGAVRGASLLILFQVGSRALTFVANQLLLRFLTARLLGVSTQLEVYCMSVLFFARESLRVAVQRQGRDVHVGQHVYAATSSTQSAVNLAHLSLPLGLTTAVLFQRFYLAHMETATSEGTPYLLPGLSLYTLAAILELLSEPAFVLMQVRLRFGVRAAAESMATFLRCAVTLTSAVWAAKRGLHLGVLPFALGQLSYSGGLLVVYGWHGLRVAGEEGFSLLPRRLATKDEERDGEGSPFVLQLFYRPTLYLATGLMTQNFFKYLLTQGDALLIGYLSTAEEQGVYALAGSYGGLVARLVLQPVEESCRNYFSSLLAGEGETTNGKTATLKRNDEKALNEQSAPEKTSTLSSVQTASLSLSTLLHTYFTLSLPILALLPPLAPLLLHILAGAKWSISPAPQTLAAYLATLPLLALNGVLEAFVSSVATQAELNGQSLFMAAFSGVFALTGWSALRCWGMGAVGIVLANGVNMACRIVWCAWFIRRYFAKRGVSGGLVMRRAVPRNGAVALGFAAVVGRLAAGIAKGEGELGVEQALVRVVQIGAVAVPFVAALAVSEREFLLQAYRTVRGQQN